MFARLSSLPLFWQVFGTNALVLVVAFLGLVFGPVTVSVPPNAGELVVLASGLLVMLAINLVLLLRAFMPLDHLADTMRRHDPLSPGRRVRVGGGPVVSALAQTFNEMLDRLEFERRDSARRALAVQEGERRRIARELHDEVGQVLTAVVLELDRLGGVVDAPQREQVGGTREGGRARPEEIRGIALRLRPDERARVAHRRGRARDRHPRRTRDTHRRARPDGRGGAGGVPRRPGGVDERRPARPGKTGVAAAARRQRGGRARDRRRRP